MTRLIAKPVSSRSQYAIEVVKPYRLDLTVSVLRRLSTNAVDVLTPGGEYVRALNGFRKTVLARVAQTQPATLTVILQGCADADESVKALIMVRRILGVERKLSHFYRGARGISWLWPLAVRMCGVKPPRYPTLWEACVNAIVFQQVSLAAASSITRRMIVALRRPAKYDDIAVYAFPDAESLYLASDDILHATGLSANKRATLRRVAEALLSGYLDESMLEECPSRDAVEILCRIKGIGPWTAAIILLRGLGRLDVFPMNDTSVARNLTFIAGASPLDIEGVLAALGPERGMLYYHLLLARLDARGDIGRASST